MKIASDDLKLYRILKQLVGSSTIELEGKAVITASLAFSWFDELEKRMLDDLNSKKSEDK